MKQIYSILILIIMLMTLLSCSFASNFLGSSTTTTTILSDYYVTFHLDETEDSTVTFGSTMFIYTDDYLSSTGVSDLHRQTINSRKDSTNGLMGVAGNDLVKNKMVGFQGFVQLTDITTDGYLRFHFLPADLTNDQYLVSGYCMYYPNDSENGFLMQFQSSSPSECITKQLSIVNHSSDFILEFDTPVTAIKSYGNLRPDTGSPGNYLYDNSAMIKISSISVKGRILATLNANGPECQINEQTNGFRSEFSFFGIGITLSISTGVPVVADTTEPILIDFYSTRDYDTSDPIYQPMDKTVTDIIINNTAETGVWNVEGTILTFTPSTPWIAGSNVLIDIPSSHNTTGGMHLTHPRSYSLTIGTDAEILAMQLDRGYINNQINDTVQFIIDASIADDATTNNPLSGAASHIQHYGEYWGNSSYNGPFVNGDGSGEYTSGNGTTDYWATIPVLKSRLSDSDNTNNGLWPDSEKYEWSINICSDQTIDIMGVESWLQIPDASRDTDFDNIYDDAWNRISRYFDNGLGYSIWKIEKSGFDFHYDANMKL